jgi:prepilin-type N-terminal cleavage/methylation domain-containing protein
MNARAARRGFSLIELLVTISIIAIVAALLLPVLGRAKETARRTCCASNLSQVNVAIRLYADDWNDSLPVLPQPNPYPNGVGAEWRLDKTQNFLTQRLALARSGTVNEENAS